MSEPIIVERSVSIWDGGQVLRLRPDIAEEGQWRIEVAYANGDGTETEAEYVQAISAESLLALAREIPSLIK